MVGDRDGACLFKMTEGAFNSPRRKACGFESFGCELYRVALPRLMNEPV